MRSTHIRYAVKVAALAVAYLATARLGHVLGAHDENVTLLWIPAGVALAVLILSGRGLWPGVALGAAVATAWTGAPLVTVIASAIGSSLAAAIGARMLERAGFRARLTHLRDVVLLAALGALASTALSATATTIGLLAAGRLAPSTVAADWVVLWVGDAMGVLLVAPAILTWAARPSTPARSLAGVEGLSLLATLLLGCAIVFGSPLPLGGYNAPTQYALEPILIWAALRFGPRGATAAVSIVWVTALHATAQGLGPFGAVGLQQAVAHTQTFAGVSMLTVLTLAAMLEERVEAERQLRQGREDLERKVLERTRDLVNANAKLQVEIDEREEAEARLRESRQAVDRIASTTPSVLTVFDLSDRRFTYANPRTEKVLGIAPDALRELSLEAITERIHPDDFAALPRLARRFATARDGEFIEAEFRMRDAGDAYHWLYARWTVFTRWADGSPRQLLGTTLDVTDRKLAEERLLEAERRAVVEYERLLERIAQLAQTLGTARDLLSIYRGVRDFSAASAPGDAVFIGLFDEARGERTAVYASGDGDEIDVSGLPAMPVTDGPNSQAIRTGEPVISGDYPARMSGRPQVVIETKQADKMPRSSLAVPMIVMGRVVGTIELQSYEPEAYRKEHATALGLAANLAAVAIENVRLLEREMRARGQAEKSNRLKDEFLATVSHELRTPLNAMLGWIHMLRSGALDPAMASRALETVERNAKAQAQLIEDILDVSRIITGKLRVSVRDTDLASLISASADAVRIAAEAKEITLETVIDARASRVIGDPDRLQQVVWNLLSNAIKFTPRGGRVLLRLDHEGDQAAIAVADTGEGIDPDFLPYVFDRFSQADSSMKRAHGGLGLGLAIVRHIAEMHGGSVCAHSAGQGRGATFVVRLPLAEERRRVSGPLDLAAIATAELGSSPLEGLRVLVVDDERDTLEMLALVLAQRGAVVKAVPSAGEALGVLSAWAPDVIVSDIGMPGQDGFELISAVRAMPADRGGATPALALTAYARPEDRRRAEDAGFQVHLGKPIDPESVVAAVAELAGRSRAAGL